MIKLGLTAFLSVFLPFNGFFGFFNGPKKVGPGSQSGVLKRLIVSDGTVKINLDRSSFEANKGAGQINLTFDIQKDALFNVTTVDDELRGPMPGSMDIEPTQKASLNGKLGESYDQLSVERPPFTEEHSLYIRNSKDGFKFFYVEGHELSYDGNQNRFAAQNGRIMITKEFARELGNDSLAGTQAGTFSIDAEMKAIEVVELSDQTNKTTIPGKGADFDGSRPGPDVVVGDVFGLAQFGSASGGMVGLALGTTSCNYGQEDLNWFRLPSNDHPVIPQNLYRMSANQDRMEQIGQSQVKHAFTALTQNLCQLGCNGTGGSRLGSGCSDPYSAGLNAGPNLGSKAWINPFTGEYPRGDSSDNPNTHSGHAHEGPSHRILTKTDDLNTNMNSGARYFAEGQYVTPHEYQWCQNNPGECNQYNNVSYREYNVNGTTTSFSFSPVGSTVREKAAVTGWPGATVVDVEPDPGNDGVARVAYKVTDLGNGTWHYEYAIHNENLDRSIRSFSVSTGSDVSVTNIGFHAPPQHPGWANDGTENSEGFSDVPWSGSTSFTGEPAVTWSTETIGQNANANAIRWGTMYNFRFRSTSPPVMRNATVGFFKTGSPMTIQVLAPEGSTVAQVNVAGRVLDFNGNPVRNAQVVLDDGQGNVRLGRTNGFGRYAINGIDAGSMYTIQAFHKNYEYAPINMQIDTNLGGLDFTPIPDDD